MKPHIIFFIIISITIIVCISISINLLWILSYKKRFRTLIATNINKNAQGVATSAKYIFIIYNNLIEKYDKCTFKLLDKIVPDAHHLNHGIVKDKVLYCIDNPLNGANVIYMYNIDTMHYQGPIDMIDYSYNGVLSSIDFYYNKWWCLYTFYKDLITKTHLVVFDENWDVLRSWTFPLKIFDMVQPANLSNIAWNRNILYCTVNNSSDIYMFKIFTTTDKATYIGKMTSGIYGQGISWDKTDYNILYGLNGDKLLTMYI